MQPSDLDKIHTDPRRLAYSSAGLAVSYYFVFQTAPPSLRLFGYLFILGLIAYIWTPRPLRTPLADSLFVILSGLSVLVAVFTLHPAGELVALLPASAGVLGSSRRLSRRHALILMLYLLLVAILCQRSANLNNIGNLLAIAGVYAGMVGGRLRRESRALDKRRLAELEEAHAELQRAHEELQLTTMQAMQNTALAERAHIARDIHDGIGHHLTSLIVQLQAVDMMLPDDPTAAKKQLPDILQEARAAVADVRGAVRTWAQDETRLGVSALRGLALQVAQRARLSCLFDAPDQISEWSQDVSVTLYRILQESMTNVLRHANAESVRIAIRESPHAVHMSVTDDGLYDETVTFAPGFGLRQMEERCRRLGGSLTLSQHVPHGLVVEATLPLLKEDAQ